ncbi:MAG: CDP-alcohol phosphatidyltransferase family protein [Planctomycetota bacterium]
MRRQIPNAITVSRLVVAALFFAMLAVYRYDPQHISWWLFASGWVYGLAAATDALDGYLARKWNATSVFGRIVDPFCDKILILGTFVFFAARPFFVEEDGQLLNLTGVGPIVVTVLLSRELLITTLRSLMEGSGSDFGAAWSGKLKMIIQSITVPVVLAYVCFRPWLIEMELELAARIVRTACVWLTVVATIVSGVLYIPWDQLRSADQFRSTATPTDGTNTGA